VLVAVVLAMIPGGLVMFMGAVMSGRSEGLGLILMMLGGLLVLPIAFYLGVSWALSPLLIIDKGYDFWPAMELNRKVAAKHFVPLLGLLICCALIGMAGVMACVVGIFVAAPVIYAALTLAYEDLFGNT
jgi:hypothetical protein